MKSKIRSSLVCYARQKKSIIEREILGGKTYIPQKRLDEANVNAFRIEKQQITHERSIINLQRDEIFEYNRQSARLYFLEHDGTTTVKEKEHRIFPQFRKAAFKIDACTLQTIML